MRCLVSDLMHYYQLCAGTDIIVVLVSVQSLEQCWSPVCRAGQTLRVSLKHSFLVLTILIVLQGILWMLLFGLCQYCMVYPCIGNAAMS